MTKLALNRTHYPVTVLGPGVRAGIWVQGCTIGCSGCVARDTWDTDGGAAVDVAAVLDWLDGIDGPVDGVTVSGGEPFQQPAALAELLSGIDAWRRGIDVWRRGRAGAGRCGRAEEVDILVYSGYPWSRLTRTPRLAALLDRCDAVICGPYLARRNSGVALRGSDNQRVVPLTPLGRRRYRSPEAGQRMQVAVTSGQIYCIGIPRSGDMDRLTEHLADAGVLLADVTWRA
ncbi:MAG: 4Fe-4S single cluster domain-containing protein [Pseudonocardiaceae bacterium]